MQARLPLLDFLRGFSLIGILAVNLPYFAEPPYGVSDFHSTQSEIARWLLSFLFTGKFFILFSFVFGYGFTILISNSEKKGFESKRVFQRRLSGLAAIGIFHACILYEGDILVTYSILGFILYRMKNLPDSILVKWIIGLFFLSILCYACLGMLSYSFNDSEQDANLRKLYNESIANHLGNLNQLTIQKLKELLYSFPYLVLYNWPSTMLMFLIGLWAGKKQLLSEPRKIWEFFHGRKRYLIVLAIVTNSCYAMSNFYSELLIYGVLFSSLLALGGISLMLIYILIWIRLFFLNNWTQPENILFQMICQAGSMSLSNYLLQSTICNWIFNGWGLGYFAQLSPECVAFLIIPIYGFNLLFSNIWKKYFNLGPMEYLLRKWTYA